MCLKQENQVKQCSIRRLNFEARVGEDGRRGRAGEGCVKETRHRKETDKEHFSALVKMARI